MKAGSCRSRLALMPASPFGRRLRRRSRLLGGLAAVLLIATPSSGLVYVMLTDEELVDRSPVIVYGTVGASSPGPVGGGGMVTTDFTFHVEESLKGSLAAGPIVVRQPGGVLRDRTARFIMGLPRLRERDRMLLFLRPEADAFATVELALGMFLERPGPRGSRLLVRDGTVAPSVGLPDDPVAARRLRAAFPRRGAEFRDWIRERVAGRERPSDYFLAEPLDEPVAVVSEYNLMKAVCSEDAWESDEEPGARGPLVRQGRFDRGVPVEFVVQADGQPHVEGGALREVWRSMAAWNEDPASRIRFAMRLTDRRNSELALLDDGLSTIAFEDPHVTFGDGAPEGGLAAASVRVRCDVPASNRPGEAAVEIVEVDIVTNAGFGAWLRDVTDDPRAYFAETMTHEIGHALGIAHSCSYDPETWTPAALGSVMRPWSNPVDEDPRSINEDDRDAASRLYPISGAGDEWIEACPWNDPETLCLAEQQYRVTAEWTTSRAGDDWRPATAEPVSANAGYFHFFDAQNPELLIKVLDGCAINGHKWVYAAGMTDVGAGFRVTELATGRERVYRKTAVGKLMPTVTDTQAFSCAAESSGAAADPAATGSAGARAASLPAADSATVPAGPPARPPASVPQPFRGPPSDSGPTYMLGERFQMYGEWTSPTERGALHGAPMTRDSMAFYFFTPENIEIVVKVLDGCAINGHRWLFMAGMTDVEFDLQVKDTQTGQLWRVANGLGKPFAPVGDVTAFPCSAPAATGSESVAAAGEQVNSAGNSAG